MNLRIDAFILAPAVAVEVDDGFAVLMEPPLPPAEIYMAGELADRLTTNADPAKKPRDPIGICGREVAALEKTAHRIKSERNALVVHQGR